MEGLLTGFAYGAFVLAACSLVASVVIFIKARVPDAIRFLRHEPLRPRPLAAVERPNSAAEPERDAALDQTCREGAQAAPATDGPSASPDLSASPDPPAHPEPPTRFLLDDQTSPDDESEDVHA